MKIEGLWTAIIPCDGYLAAVKGHGKITTMKALVGTMVVAHEYAVGHPPRNGS